MTNEKEIRDKEHEDMKEKLTNELETQDEVGYWGGFNKAPPTIKKRADGQIRYSQHDRDWVWMALSACEGENRNADNAYAIMCKWHAEDERIPRIPPNMIKRWMREYTEERIAFLASTRAVDCLEDLFDRCPDWRTKFSASKELLDRAFGKPTQRVEVEQHVLDWSDLKKRRDEGAKEYASGEWFKENGEPLDKPAESEYDEK